MAENSPSGPRGQISPLPNSPFIPKPEFPETGWERVRELFQVNEFGQYSEEVYNMQKGAFISFVFGMLYGGVPAARYSREQYIKKSQAEIYEHRGDAYRAAGNAATRGFIRYGVRWGWRIAAFVTIFNGVSTVLNTYRDKFALSHYTAAGAVTGGLFRLSLGLRGLVSGSIIGAAFGLPAGALMSLLQTLCKEDMQETKRRKRRELYEQKLQEWQERLSVSDDLIREMQEEDAKPAASDLQKIAELLHQPRNPDQNQRSESPPDTVPTEPPPPALH